MTLDQERTYLSHRAIGWEFSHWEGENVVMQLWQHQTAEFKSLLCECMIDKYGCNIDL
jgi:hypothetical protein